MKVDVTQTLTALSGEAVREPAAEDGEKGKEFTLRAACVNALMAVMEKDNNLSGEDKLKSFELAKRIQNDPEPDLTPEELTKIKDRVGKAYGPVIVGPVFTILNGS